MPGSGEGKFLNAPIILEAGSLVCDVGFWDGSGYGEIVTLDTISKF